MMPRPCSSPWARLPTRRAPSWTTSATPGRRAGTIGVTAYRPFPADALAEAVGGARAVAVVERTDEPAAADNPLTRELKAALADRAARGASIPLVVSASAGLGSRDVSVGDLAAIFDWLDAPGSRGPTLGEPRNQASSALDRRRLSLRPEGAYSLRGHSIGGLGSVTTNKLLATIMGELFGKYVQAYPRYGSEKKGLPDDLLPDARRRADPRPLRAEDGRLRATSRRVRLPPGRT